MTALDGWIDVCRTGTWRDASNREVEVTEATLESLAAGYGAQDPAPVVVGHPATDAPAWGWVEGLRRVGDRLQARFRDIAPEFRSAVEQGRYAGRSIAIAGGQLRHVGFLGGRAPAVPGLAPTQFSAAPDQVVEFAVAEDGTLAMPGALGWARRTLADIVRGFREDVIAEKGIEAADERIPSWLIDELLRVAEEVSEPTLSTSEEPPVPPEKPENQPDAAELAARAATLDAREARLAAAERTRAADAVLEAHVAAGRVLPAERGGLAALLASLPEDDTVIAFAAAEGGGEVQEKPRAVLERFLGALPKRVDYDERAGGRMPPAPEGAGTRIGEDDAGVAAEARVLMSEAAARGETLSAVQAVDQVRRKRGLSAGGA